MFFQPIDRKQRLHNFHQQRLENNHVAAISEYAKQEAIKNGMKPEQIIAIPIRLAKIKQFQLEKTIEQEGRNPFLLYPANLWPHKNHELLLTAWAMARQQGLSKRLNLICTGEGGGRRKWLEELTRELQLEDCVSFTGFVSEQEINEFYMQTIGVIFPSLYEGFGMPIVEAMQRGIPLACSNNTACQEISGGASFLFDPRCPQQLAEALIKLSSNKQLRENQRQLGLKRSERYQDLDIMVNDYWKLFQEALR
ncbi:glycosyltransferase family 4 protein [Cyanobacteria bacterium 150NLHA]|nr:MULTISPECIES: glycosyltransferase family 1 protein [unclassified Prochlorococcus]NMP05469.1 glycosyltransferase family 4 protein [Prochlorococcus sp. P1361]NMP13047.1 glycosyltransferase family 4 protein [Prochlorococcus sp.P1363]